MRYLLLSLLALSFSLLSCTPRLNEENQKENGEIVNNIPATKEIAEGDTSDHWLKKSREGIDFMAAGNEPFWSLEIDFENKMTFSTMEEPDKMSMPVPDPVRPQDIAAISYRANTENGNLYVTIFSEKCMDSMSGQKFPYRIKVSVKAADSDEYEEFIGCGRYLGDYRMNDIWALTEMDGQAISPEDFSKGVPTLDLQLKGRKVFGHAGCNRINGTFTLGKGELTFDLLVSTRMACPVMQFEHKFLSALSGSTLSYKLDGMNLHLQSKDHQLTFKKVD